MVLWKYDKEKLNFLTASESYKRKFRAVEESGDYEGVAQPPGHQKMEFTQGIQAVFVFCAEACAYIQQPAYAGQPDYAAVGMTAEHQINGQL